MHVSIDLFELILHKQLWDCLENLWKQHMLMTCS